MKAVLDQIDFLHLYIRSSPSQHHALIESMSKTQLHALLEVIFNVLKGTIKLSMSNKTLLSRYKKIIRQVVDRHISSKNKQDLLQKYRKIFRLIVRLCLKRIEDERYGTRTSFSTKKRI